MPDFTFTSPEGKDYTVSGPEGSTKEQAFAILQTQLAAKASEPAQKQPEAKEPASTAGGRAKDFVKSLSPEETFNKAKALDEPSEKPTAKGAASAIGTSTAVGAAIGALSPEIVTGLGIAASFIPGVGEVAGPALMAAGQTLRAGRLGAAVMGGVSGLTSESAGQVVEAAGGTKGQAAAARFLGGNVPAGAATLAEQASKFVPSSLKTVWGAVQKIASVDQETGKAVQAAKENLAKMGEAGQPQTAMHAMLQKGIEADRQAAEQLAKQTLADAHQRAADVARTDADAATRLVDEARARADQIRADAAKRASVLEKASDGKLATANRVLAQAQPELAKVGNAAELSDIGNNLRQAATATQGAKIQARNESYRALQAERDAVVAQKEAAGNTIDKLPEMKALRAEIGKYTLTNEEGRKAAGGLARATEPGVLRAYTSVEDAIKNRRVQVGVDPETGNPKFQTFRTTFEAIDAVRRRLGDALAGGQTAEGYEALGKGIASKLYERLSKIQEAYVGKDAAGRNLQRELQSGYAEGTEGVKGFGTAAGKKLTAADRVDPERFNADPKTLPKYFFNSQQSVRDAIELTGNKELVHQQAANYAARSMQGMSAKQAKSWIAEQSDWMREVPGLQAKANAYANKLEQIERVNNKLVKRAGAADTEAGAIRGEGVKAAEKERQAGIERATKAAEGSVATQQRVLDEGAKAAEAAKQQKFAGAESLQKLLQSGEAPETVNKLLLSGNQQQTRLAAGYLASQPGGQKVLEQSVRQVMRGMSEGTVRNEWFNRIQPMLRDGKMLSPERLQALETDVNRLLQSYKGPGKEKLIARHVLAAINSSVGAASTYAPGRERENRQ